MVVSIIEFFIDDLSLTSPAKSQNYQCDSGKTMIGSEIFYSIQDNKKLDLSSRN